MTSKEAQIIIGNIPIKPEVLDDCYSIAEYQEAKAMAIKALGQENILRKVRAMMRVYYEHTDRAISEDELFRDGYKCGCSHCIDIIDEYID